MPLPPALAARLKKRGILKLNAQNAPDEEIIAEDYSEENEQPEEESKQEELQILINNTNLPPGWWKVKDPSTSFTYYWDSETDKVCWKHPMDNDAEITYCTTRLEEVEKEPPQENDQPLPPGTENTPPEEEDENPFGAIPMVGPMDPPKEPPPRKSYRDRDRERSSRGGRRGDYRESRKRKHKEEELDPMDPAAYSEVPRGTWATGLPKQNEAKTGVDDTANGPLFQMRPYPSPGAILRANAKAKNPEDD